MLIDIRKSKYGFVRPVQPKLDVSYQPTEIQLLLSQRPSDGGLPLSTLSKYLDKSTPLDIKMQLESLMSSLPSRPGFDNEDDAFASVLDRHLSVSELEDIIDSDNNSNLQDNG